jgi:hypothetical protein
MARVNWHSTRTLVWTTILILFVAFEIYAQYPWLSLVIPGTILMWYGLLAQPPSRIAMRKHSGSSLN